MSGIGFVKTVSISLATIVATVLALLPAHAEVLQGSVTKTGIMMRLARPGSADMPGVDGPPLAPAIRLTRPTANLQSSPGIVDTAAFKPALSGQAREDELRLGVVKPDEFQLPRGFDLGAERGSRELTLAWEKWHKQFSQAIYDRWSSAADEPGRATVRVTVNKDRQVTVAFMNSNGSRRFDRKLESVIAGLSGNPGLTFPSKSQRSVVSFEADYIAAHNVTPGYSWVKDDYEKVRQHY